MKRSIFKKVFSFITIITLAIGLWSCGDNTKTPTDLEVLNEALGTISMPTSVDKDLTIPTLDSKYEGIIVSFVSSNTAFIANDGKVTRSTEDVTVTVTITLNKNADSVNKSFSIKVLKREYTDTEKIAKTKEALILTGINQLISDIALPTSNSTYGSAISWETSDATVITKTGVITRPEYGQTASTATLTATIVVGSVIDTKAFAVTVLPKGADSVNPTVAGLTATITMVEEKPTLTVTGKVYYAETAAVARTIVLVLGKDNHVLELANDVTEAAKTDGSFKFIQDLSNLALIPNNWTDMKVRLTEAEVTKTVDLTANATILDEFVTVGNITYKFEEYNTDLKLHKKYSAVISANTSSTVFVSFESGKPYLNVIGSLYFDAATDITREIKLTISHEKLDKTIVVSNSSVDADTRKFIFKQDLSNLDLSKINGDWLTLKIVATETNGSKVLEYNEDVIPGTIVEDVKTFDYIKYKLYGHEGKWLKLILQSDVETHGQYLTSNEVLFITKEEDKVYLNLKGKAYISSTVEEIQRTITLLIGDDVYQNRLAIGNTLDGSYEFKADITGKYVNSAITGINIKIVEGTKEGTWEIKQAAWDDATGSIVPKPESGTSILSDCGKGKAGLYTYGLAVDQWNNIKITVEADMILSELKTKEDINIIEEGNKVYLVVKGYAYIEKDAESRTIKLSFEFEDEKDYKNENQYTGSDKTIFEFKIDITNTSVRGGAWYKIGIEVSEGAFVVRKAFANDTFEESTDDKITTITCGRTYVLAYSWGQVHVEIHDSQASGTFNDEADKLSLTEEDGHIYLNMSGKAYITESRDVVRVIELAIVKGDGDNMTVMKKFANLSVETDGTYLFKADITGLFGNEGALGLRILVTEIGYTTPVSMGFEAKQDTWNGAGTLVTRPDSGTATIHSIPQDLYTYSLIVDQWNNIKIKVEIDAYLSNLVTQDECTIIEESGDVYLIINGNAYVKEDAENRVITFSLEKGDPNFQYENSYVGSDTTAFTFKIKLNDLASCGWDWIKFAVSVVEDGHQVKKEFATWTFTGPVESDVIVRVENNNRTYILGYAWGNVFVMIQD